MKKYIDNLKTKNIHIVGAAGTEGSAVLEFLVENGIKNITAHDFSRDQEDLRKNFFKTHLWLKGKEKVEAFEKFLQLPINLKLKDKYLEGVSSADIIFASSSWHLYKPNFPMLEAALKEGIEFSSITKLYFALAKGKIISVTGTKGKGTTSRLIYKILLKSGKKKNVYLAGNDRRSAQELDKVSKMKKDDILVLETSNRQLMIDIGRSPDIGVITNISPDHIGEHGSFENYIEAKKSLFGHAKKGDLAVLNYDNEITREIGEEMVERGLNVFFFSRKEKMKKGAFLENGKIYILGNGASKSLGHSISELKKEYICDLSDIKIIGEHNIENVLAAVLVGFLAGAMPEEIKSAVRNFRGLPHRLEFIGEYNGVKFYDDLASTNPDSTIAAINALKSYYNLPASPKLQRGEQPTTYNLVLVAGGDDKGMDYAELTKVISEKVGLLILLPGTGSEKIKFQIPKSKFQTNSPPTADPPKVDKLRIPKPKQSNNLNIFKCNDFLGVLSFIKAQIKTGDIVLVSPASAHFQERYIDVLKKPIRNLIVENFR